jgi:hypothetical protein
VHPPTSWAFPPISFMHYFMFYYWKLSEIFVLHHVDFLHSVKIKTSHKATVWLLPVGRN